MKKINPVEAQVLVGKGEVVVLDVRTLAEFAEGHIAGAKNIDIYSDEFSEAVRTLPADATYVVNCRSGARSSQACSFMEELGFRNVMNLEGGIMAWMSAGLATEK
ncbi:MAG: rhodanese-like domain-containing protein [Candidatus Pacebacteria bacterium]|jgi:rhodanese-related sulfurtransferase|nr:rhodanese-like domain-containing protein [Candidatus Paceibacterota bacterium]